MRTEQWREGTTGAMCAEGYGQTHDRVHNLLGSLGVIPTCDSSGERRNIAAFLCTFSSRVLTVFPGEPSDVEGGRADGHRYEY